MINIIFTICLVTAGIYLLASVVLTIGGRRFRRNEIPPGLPSVSVILCARNEEAHLPRCLASLGKLDYPLDKLEIILVDDSSDDRTPAILETFAEGESPSAFFTTKGLTRTLPGKQFPLYCGLKHASGDIICVTDADCVVEPSWVSEHVAAYSDNIGIVGGVTGIDTGGRGVFALVQMCDQVSKLSIAKGCAGLGIPLTLMGNNISFRRATYDSCGGFESIGPSLVEDVDLLFAIVRNTPYRLGWLSMKRELVKSAPSASFASFVSQRRRMFRINAGFPAVGKLMIGFELFVTLLVFVSAFAAGESHVPITILAAAWLTGNTVILAIGMSPGIRHVLCLPLLFLFQILYGTVAGSDVLFGGGSIDWKGRSYDKSGNK